MDFTPIDMRSWPRAGIYHYFAKMAPTGYSLTAEVDVSALRASLKGAGLKFFPAYLWLVTGTLCLQNEFRTAEREDVLGFYDSLTPLYAVFHEDDHTFSLMWSEYSPDFHEFYSRYTENAALYGQNHGVLAQPGLPPENCYTVSCLPWVSFTHFAVHSYENKPYFFPSVEAGRFFEREGRTIMPLSMTCHHATTDGWHISRFLEELQRRADAFDPSARDCGL